MNNDPNDRSLQRIIPPIKQLLDSKQKECIALKHKISETSRETIMETSFSANLKKSKKIKLQEEVNKVNIDIELLNQLLTILRGQIGRINVFHYNIGN